MKDAEKDFRERKTALLERVAPHMLDPDSYPMPRLSLEDCAILMAPSADRVPSRMTMCKAEHSALTKMREGLERLGVNGMSDIAPV